MTDKNKYPEMLQSDRADEMLDSITITEEELKKRKSKKSSLPTYVRTKKKKPDVKAKPKPPLPPDVKKAIKENPEARDILIDLYKREQKNKKARGGKVKYNVGGIINPSFSNKFRG
jgi:hypothetical protein